MTTFKIWKVQHGCPGHHVWHTFSFRIGAEIPAILNQDQFKILFPDIDPKTVPAAPATATIEIEARLT